MIKVENLKKKYGEVEALKGISFSIDKGEIIGFLGPNGAGKTTCMKILTGFLAPNQGEVTIAGYNLADDEQALKSRKLLGYLPENAPLYQDMVVFDYLKFIAEVRGIEPKKRDGRIFQVSKMCGVLNVLGKYINELSKGYRQRVALAQSLIHDPEILILDEPTTGLDPNQIVEIRNLIKEIGQKRTVILSTHNLPEVVQTCSRIIIVHNGKIVADGTAENLESQGKTTQVINTKFRKTGNTGEIKKVLTEIPGVSLVVDKIDAEKNVIAFRLELKQGTDPRQAIYEKCAEKNLPLLELWRDVIDLEKLFSKLTKE